MASNVWVASQLKQAQVNTITPANVNIGNTFTVTINSKAYTFTATAATVANVTAGLVALLQASPEGEFTEITWADNTTSIGATSATPGVSFTQTSAATGGTATLVTSTTKANKSPSDVNDALNWSLGAVPGNGDDVYFDGTAVTDALYNLSALSAVTLASLNISNAYTGSIGLPKQNANGYTEYRSDYFAISATLVFIGDTQGSGSGRIKINLGTVQSAIIVNNTGTGTEVNLEALLLKGTHASNTAVVNGGSVGFAVFGGETTTLTSLTIAQGDGGDTQPSAVRCGEGCTLTTVVHSSGKLVLSSAVTTFTVNGGTVTMFGTSADTIGTLSLWGGVFSLWSTGTITTLKVGSGATLDCSQDPRARTVTNSTIFSGGSVLDPSASITWTNAALLSGARLGDVTIDVGPNRNIKVT